MHDWKNGDMAQVAAVSEAGRAYVWECRADAAGRVEAELRARISVGPRCCPLRFMPIVSLPCTGRLLD